MVGWVWLVVIVAVLRTTVRGEDCTYQHDVEYIGSDIKKVHKVTSAAGCCQACQGVHGCRFFTYEPTQSTCYLKDTNAPDHSKPKAGAVSGYPGTSPPTPPPPGSVELRIDDTTAISKTADRFVCWNIDASPNRQFFTRDLQDPKLKYLAGQLGGNYLRFGGTGNDHLTYNFGSTTCIGVGCLNQTQWDNLYSLARDADMKLVVGLNVLRRNKTNGHWDPTNARELLQYSRQKGYQFFGFELGNEENKVYTGKELAAESFKVLYDDLLVPLWPDAATRPVMLGPDPHSFKQNGPDSTLLNWMADFMDEATRLNLPLHAITHHEYVEVDASTFYSAAKLDVTGDIARAVKKTCTDHYPTAEVWAGEIGPHNGGSPPCSHASMRWANFGDSAWYLDALGTKAASGYQAFCRQDFIGADYGLLDCSTSDPLPDYYSALLWNNLMGSAVLHVNTPANASAVRAYAHCSTTAGSVTLLVLNLANVTVKVHVAGNYTNHARVEYHLTATDGPLGTGVALNGAKLVMTNGKLPSLTGKNSSAGTPLLLQPRSYVFVEYVAVGAAACPPA